MGVLIVAGLADPCGDIGTQCRYDLLPIPWEASAFRASVSGMIKTDKWAVSVQELNPDSYRVGVRCWIWRSPESRPLELLITKDWSVRRGKKAGRLIDGLSFGVPAIEYAWPSENPDDDEAISILEKALLFRLENDV